jgi:DNA mismatch endonuclease (patch repair protein)
LPQSAPALAMVDNRTKDSRSRLMSRVGSKHTKPELIVRSLLHRMGYRYRLHRKDLPGRPDIAFIGRKKAIFVHGCFWHGHGCKIGKLPKSNLEFWSPKIERNRLRDRQNISKLEQIGWEVAEVWQCELKEVQSLEARLQSFLGPPKPIDIH